MSFYLMHRGWMDGELFAGQRREPFDRRSAWVWLIEHAAFDGDGRGQLSHSIRYLAKAWGWSSTKVFRFIAVCVSLKMIECSSETGQLSIRLCKYDIFQSIGQISGTQKPVTVEQTRNATGTDIKEGTRKEVEEDTPLTGGVGLARELVAIWNTECGDALPRVERLTAKRIQKFELRFHDELGGGMEAWRELCCRIRRSHFLVERWHASIDWVLEPGNFLKIQEGNYDNRPTSSKQGGPHDAETAAFERVTRSSNDRSDDSSSNVTLLDPTRAFR